jgi:hypothetical protein
MAATSHNKNFLSDHPVIVLIGVVAALVVIIAFATGAVSLPDLIGNSLERQIIGTWEDEDGYTMTFLKGGVFHLGGVGFPVSGNYSIVDSNHIQVEAGGFFALGGPRVFKVNISGNYMTLTDPENVTFEFQKIN